MTVQELKKELEGFDDETDVYLFDTEQNRTFDLKRVWIESSDYATEKDQIGSVILL